MAAGIFTADGCLKAQKEAQKHKMCAERRRMFITKRFYVLHEKK